jgi:hypothetical protein
LRCAVEFGAFFVYLEREIVGARSVFAAWLGASVFVRARVHLFPFNNRIEGGQRWRLRNVRASAWDDGNDFVCDSIPVVLVDPQTYVCVRRATVLELDTDGVMLNASQ